MSYLIYRKNINDYYETMTANLARTEALSLDSETVGRVTEAALQVYREICREEGGAPDFDAFSQADWDAYYARYMEVTATEDYQSVLQRLQEIALANDVASIYVCYIDLETDKAVYIVDGSETGACLMGTCDNLEPGVRSLMEQGIWEFPAYITDYENYGWLCSAAAPILDGQGGLIANAYVDISMDEVAANSREFLFRLAGILAAAACVMIAAMIAAVNRTIVSPVNVLAKAAESFVSDREEHGGDTETAISRLHITTGDEIQHLAESVQKMETEINEYIRNLTAVTAEKERIGAELDVARHIQSSMLPCIFPAFPDRLEFDIYASMDPAREVGGDFYDFFMVDQRHLAVVVADVSGKGVPAALFMVIGKTLIKDHTQPGEDLGQVFTKVNELLCESNSEGLFITAFEGVLDLATGDFTYVNAGHEIPYLYRKGEGFVPHKIRPGFVLAGMEGMKYHAGSIRLQEGDKIFQYTDGVTEAMDQAGSLYGSQRLVEVLNRFQDKEPEALLKAVKEDINAFVGQAQQFDDITMLCLEFRKKMGEEGAALMKELTIDATVENIGAVTEFVNRQLEECGCSPKARMQIDIAIDELFGNIAHYAYRPQVGPATVRVEVLREPLAVVITFIDHGVPYDPLAKSDPDITLPAEQREVGGLGIYIVKKSMDEITYEYKNGQNILRIKKRL